MSRARKPPRRNPDGHRPSGRPESLDLASGVNREGKPFVAVSWGDKRGQWTVQECRHHAMVAIGAAEAAEHDALFAAWLQDKMGVPIEGVAAAISDLRQHRAAESAPPVPDGRVAFVEGVQFGPERARPSLLDPPPPGVHLWIATVAHVLTPESAAQAHVGGSPVHLDSENLADISFGCYVCEQPYTPELAARPCAGESP